jgi:hypothetical protein
VGRGSFGDCPGGGGFGQDDPKPTKPTINEITISKDLFFILIFFVPAKIFFFTLPPNYLN